MENIQNQPPNGIILLTQLRSYTYGLGVILAITSSLLLSWASLSWLVGLLGIVMVSSTLLLLIRYPIMGIPFVLALAPLAAYEARAGIPFVGFLPISLGQIAFLGLILLWGTTRFVNKRNGFPQAKSFTWLLIFAGIMLITTLSAESTADGAKEVIKWIQLGLMMLICLDLVQHTSPKWHLAQNRIWLPICFLIIGGLSQSLIGIYQFTNPDGPESFLILGRFYRAFGTFEQPNPYGGYIAWHLVFFTGLILPSLIDWLMHFIHPDPEKGTKPLNGLIILGVLLVITIMGVALVASWSRGAWLAAIAGFGTMAFYLPKDRKTGIALILVGVLGVVVLWQSGLLPESVTSRLASSTEIEFAPLRDQEVSPANFAVLERQAFWQAAFSMFESDIWTGVGFGNYDAAYPDHYVGTWERSLGHAHNYYINLLAETGLLGLLAYLLFWLTIIGRLIHILPTLTLFDRGIVLGLMGVWVSLSVHHLVDKLYVNNNWLTLGVFLAIQEIILLNVHRNAQAESQLFSRL